MQDFGAWSMHFSLDTLSLPKRKALAAQYIPQMFDSETTRIQLQLYTSSRIYTLQLQQIYGPLESNMLILELLSIILPISLL